MKTFKQYIIEEVLSFADALKIFNIGKVPSSKSDFDKLYKQLALKNHPDLGGSTEAMKKLNMAKEILSKHLGRGTLAILNIFKASENDRTSSIIYCLNVFIFCKRHQIFKQ